MFKKSIAAVALAAVVFLAVPSAALAYSPTNGGTAGDSTPAPGTSTTVSFADGLFFANETVNFTVTGEGSATLAALAATVSLAKTASATGAVSVTVTLPAAASGTYTVTGTGATSGNVWGAVLTVTPADAGGLPNTGSTVPVLWIWVGGGALALGIAMVVILAITRRQQAARN